MAVNCDQENQPTAFDAARPSQPAGDSRRRGKIRRIAPETGAHRPQGDDTISKTSTESQRPLDTQGQVRKTANPPQFLCHSHHLIARPLGDRAMTARSPAAHTVAGMPLGQRMKRQSRPCQSCRHTNQPQARTEQRLPKSLGAGPILKISANELHLTGQHLIREPRISTQKKSLFHQAIGTSHFAIHRPNRIGAIGT